MPKQALSLIVLLISLLANYSISAKSSEQSIAPAASESENKSISPESLPVLPDPDSPTTEVEAEAQILSPTYFFASPTSSIPDVETQLSQTLSQENNSTLSNADAPSLENKAEESTLSQEVASSPSVNDLALESNQGDETISTSLSPSNVDTSVLDTQDTDNNLSQENASLPPAIETKENEDLFQENKSLPPPSYLPDGDTLGLEENKSPALPPAYVENTTPALDISDDGSFTQENQSPLINAPAPETKGEEDFTTQDYPSSATSPNPESQNPQLNDYSSLPKSAPEAESDPTIQTTPSNDETLGLAPTSHKTILPFNYRAEDEPVEPYEDEEDSWNGVNGAVAGVMVGACVVGVGGFIYQKRKKDNIRAQYTCLAKKGGV